MESTELGWSAETWKEIYDDVLKEVGKVRVAQKVFSATVVTNDATQIPNEVIDFDDLTVKEGDTKPFVELYRDFSLTMTQVSKETEQKLGATLARMGAKEIALAEDAYVFQISDRTAARGEGGKVPVLANKAIHADNWRTDRDFGLLGEANSPDADDANPAKPSTPISVPRVPAASGLPGSGLPSSGLTPSSSAVYGEETFKAVADGIARLVGKAQAPSYALFLPTRVYADTFIPPSPASLVTTADRIRPLVEGGFYTSGVLPPDEGLLVALGGEPVKLLVGREAGAEYVRKEGAKYFFRVVERFQYIVRDPRALVLLKFV